MRLGASLASASAATTDLARIRKAGTLRVAVLSRPLNPYLAAGKDGAYTGVDATILGAVARARIRVHGAVPRGGDALRGQSPEGFPAVLVAPPDRGSRQGGSRGLLLRSRAVANIATFAIVFRPLGMPMDTLSVLLLGLLPVVDPLVSTVNLSGYCAGASWVSRLAATLPSPVQES